MKKSIVLIIAVIYVLVACNNDNKSNSMGSSNSNLPSEKKIVFLHHSTGQQIVMGSVPEFLFNFTKTGSVHKWFKKYNKKNDRNYVFVDQAFPKREPYGWNNYPYDYYNIWVKNGENDYYMEEPTLRTLTKEYDLIIFKHCYPVCRIEKGSVADINSEEKTLDNYMLQYQALKERMHEFEDTKFLVWTGAVLVQSAMTLEQSKNAKIFFEWVRNEWDEEGDNIYIWDFYSLETEGELFLKPENARSATNSHLSDEFAKRTYPLFCQRIIDVIEGKGDSGNITGAMN